MEGLANRARSGAGETIYNSIELELGKGGHQNRHRNPGHRVKLVHTHGASTGPQMIVDHCGIAVKFRKQVGLTVVQGRTDLGRGFQPISLMVSGMEI